MSQGSLNPKIRFLGQKMWPVARGQTHRQTDTKVTTVGTLSGFQEFFLQPTTKDQPNNNNILVGRSWKNNLQYTWGDYGDYQYDSGV